jgi:hypothetical protein
MRLGPLQPTPHMKKLFQGQVATRAAILCLALLALPSPAAEFVEIAAEIDTWGYALGDAKRIVNPKPRTLNVICITGPNRWYITNDLQQSEEWLFDGSNVLCRIYINLGDQRVKDESWPSRDGHPMGHFAANIPWLAFCSGAFLKGEGRRIPLPAAALRHCPDRFAYTDVTTTFADELGLPRTMDLFNSQELFLKSHTDWDMEQGFGNRYTEWNKKTAPKIQDGLLVFHYAVLESTNVLGRNYPTKFEFFQTGRPYEQNGNWFCSGMGRVKSIRPSKEKLSWK